MRDARYGSYPAVTHSMPRAAWIVLGSFVVFLGVIAYLVTSSLTRREVATFDPPAQARARQAHGIDTMTIDATSNAGWIFVDLARGDVRSPPDTAGWDLAFRRYHVKSSGSVADLGLQRFADVRSAPSHGYLGNATGRDSLNTAMARWYSYSMLTHLLEPLGHVYVVRMRDGGYAKLEMLSYYCSGMRPGCVTFRYALIAAPAER